MEKMTSEKRKRGRLYAVKILAQQAAESEDARVRLLESALSEQRERSVNALWAMTHLRTKCRDWLASHQSLFIERLLVEKDTTKKRLLLQLLREQNYAPAEVRTDFLDWCLSRINEEKEPYAIRAFCIYTAFRMCRHYPELLTELRGLLDLLAAQQPLSPGLRCAHSKTLAAIERELR